MSFVRTGMTYQPSSVGNNTIKNQTKQNSECFADLYRQSKQQLTFPVFRINTRAITNDFLLLVFPHHIRVKHLLRLPSNNTGYPFPVHNSLTCDNEMHCALS